MAESFLGVNPRQVATYDAALQLRDAVAMTATGAFQVGGSNKILDLGVGEYVGIAIVDITAIGVVGTESYKLTIQGSNASDFSGTPEVLAQLHVGHSSTLIAGATTTVGRYLVPFRNEKNGTFYRYIRGHATIAGTTPTITFTAYLAKNDLV